MKKANSAQVSVWFQSGPLEVYEIGGVSAFAMYSANGAISASYCFFIARDYADFHEDGPLSMDALSPNGKYACVKLSAVKEYSKSEVDAMLAHVDRILLPKTSE